MEDPLYQAFPLAYIYFFFGGGGEGEGEEGVERKAWARG